MSVVDSTLDVAAFVREFHGMQREDFLAANPHPFLIGDAQSFLGGGAAFRTHAVSAPVELDDVVDRPTDKSPRPGVALVPDRIYPVRKRPGTPFPHMISVGRSGNNDVVLPFGAVSKLHAFFSHVPETDVWSLVDADSSNGTMIDHRPCVPNERYAVADGATLVFGDIALSFMLPEVLYESLGELARRLVRAGVL